MLDLVSKPTPPTHEQRNMFMDVLRSVAIIEVVNCHWGSSFSTGVTQNILGLGGRGVDLFFVLSGWLLGRQLLKELNQTGKINVGRFWLRRWFRTLPAYYAILAFTYFWQIAVKQNYDLDLTYVWFGQTYFSNMPYFGVSWSLCVEEHFYLMIAPLLLLSTRRAGWVILAVYMLLPGLFRTWLHGEINYEQTHFRWDQCGAGVVLAGLSLHWSAMWKFLCRYAVVFSCCGVVVVLLNLYWRIAGIDGIQAWSFGMWSLISMTWVLLANSSEYWQRQAGCWLTRYIADRSYSLYLVHIEAIVIVKKLELTSFTSWITCWIVSLIAAEILYRVVERPWLKLRDWVCENRFVSPAPVAKETVAEKVVLTPSCQR